jgi:hypothetical protein
MPSLFSQKVASWVICSGFAILSLMYLNGAFFSAWVSGGPPNDNPLGWERRAIGQLALSVAALVLSIGSYRLISRLPKWSKSSIALVAVGITLALSPYAGRLALQESCFSHGGKWSNDQLICIKEAK